MKKTCLFLLSKLLFSFGLLAQPGDTGTYRSRKLQLDEVNLVSSYYKQDGNNSAVTGGVGTEKLTDFSNQFEFVFHQYNRKGRRVNWEAGLGVDYYTSASSDKINPYSISSASSRDLRIYPSVVRETVNDSSGYSWQTGISYSHESDYRSHGILAGWGWQSQDRNNRVSARLKVYFDQVKIILPIELRTRETGGLPDAPNQYDYPWRRRHTWQGTFSWSAIVHKRLQWSAVLDPSFQSGFLGLPFHRIYFTNGVLSTEKLPRNRFKLPLGFRASWFAGDKFIVRPFYRFYLDDWGMRAHTAEMELTVKLTPFLSVSPFGRLHHQSGIRYFAGYREHDIKETFYSSNFDLSGFTSFFSGMGLRYHPMNGLLGNKRFPTLEIRYGHYSRSNGLAADILSVFLAFRPKG